MANEIIGQVETSEGTVTAIHANGTSTTLSVGAPVFEGDVIKTEHNSSIGITFKDESSFSLDENGSIILDEMVYDADSGEGVFGSTLTSGIFSFVSGQIAKANPDAMVINTPVATVGIRGTQGVIKQNEDGKMEAILMKEADGSTGEIILSNSTGVVTLNQPNQFSVISSPDTIPTAPVVLTLQELSGTFGTNSILVLNNTRRSATLRKAQEKSDQAEDGKRAAQEAQQAADEAEIEAEALAIQAEEAAEAAKAAQIEALNAEAEEAAALLAEAERLATEAQVAEALAAQAAAQAELLSQQAAIAQTAAQEAEEAARIALDEANQAARAQITFASQADEIEQKQSSEQTGTSNISPSSSEESTSTQDDDTINNNQQPVNPDAAEPPPVTAPPIFEQTIDDEENNNPVTETQENTKPETSLPTTQIGGSGNDILTGNSGANELFGLDGDDTLYGNGGSDILFGGNGNDRLEGGEDNDTFVGENGNDIIIGGNGYDVIDLISPVSNEAVIITLTAPGTGQITDKATTLKTDSFEEIEKIFLDKADNDITVKSHDAAKSITIAGGKKTDTLFYEDTSNLNINLSDWENSFSNLDKLDFTANGIDISLIIDAESASAISEDGTLFINGDSNDSITLYDDDYVQGLIGTGPDGKNYVSYYSIVNDSNLYIETDINVSLVDKPIVFSGTSENENIYGAGNNDTLKGNAGDDVIQGFNGKDLLYDGEGQDNIRGGQGEDTIYAASDTSSDVFIGEGGTDILTLDGENFSNILATVTIDGANSGTLELNGSIDSFSQIEIVTTLEQDDTINLETNGSINTVQSGDGNDTININGGSWGQVEAGNGNDIINVNANATGTFLGEDGDDLFNISNASDLNMLLDGGNGNNDTLHINANMTLNLTSGSFNASNFEILDLTSSAVNLTIGSNVTSELSGASTLVINGDSDDTVNLSNAYSLKENISGYSVYQDNNDPTQTLHVSNTIGNVAGV